MDEFNIGDLVYCSKKGFGHIVGREFHRKFYRGAALKLELEGTGKKIWYVTENALIKVEPDTPENRLLIQLKYG